MKSCDQGGDLEPWDEGYFTWLMKASAYNLNSLVSGMSLFLCDHNKYILFIFSTHFAKI